VSKFKKIFSVHYRNLFTFLIILSLAGCVPPRPKPQPPAEIKEVTAAKRMNENLSNSKIINIKSYVGRYATSMEMAGMSITTLKLNNDLKKYLFASSKCPFWND